MKDSLTLSLSPSPPRAASCLLSPVFARKKERGSRSESSSDTPAQLPSMLAVNIDELFVTRTEGERRLLTDIGFLFFYFFTLRKSFEFYSVSGILFLVCFCFLNQILPD